MAYILIIVLLITIGTLFIILESAMERRTIELCHYHVKSDKLKKETKLTFLVVADLHSKDYGDNNRALIHTIKGENPDGILIPGDLIIGSKGEDFKVALDLLNELVKIAPVYYSHGNHEDRMKYYRYNEMTRTYETDYTLLNSYKNNDSSTCSENHQVTDGISSDHSYTSKYDNYRKLVDATGAILLDNETITVDMKDNKINISGLSISLKYFEKFNHTLMEKEEVEALLQRDNSTIETVDSTSNNSTGSDAPKKLVVNKDNYHIVLAHNPAHMEAYTQWGADLTVSGHLHGGIIRLPFLGGIITPQVKLLPQYSGGLYKVNGKSAVVSRGLGEHTVNIRVFNPPELSVIHITN